MAAFSKISLDKLSKVHPDLVRVLTRAIRIMDFTIIYGYRSAKEQQQLYEKGLSQKTGGNSKHNTNPSEAIDIAPYPINWKDTDKFYLLAGVIKAAAFEEGVRIRWGGDWDSDGDLHDQTFMDLGHFEYIGG